MRDDPYDTQDIPDVWFERNPTQRLFDGEEWLSEQISSFQFLILRLKTMFVTSFLGRKIKNLVPGFDMI